MSKTLYQFKIDPEQRSQLENLLHIAIQEERYKSVGHSNLYALGTGWLTASRKIQYKITGNILSLCIWKAVAVIVPSLEVGSCSADNFYGSAFNSSMKNAIDRIAMRVGQHCMLVPLRMGETVSGDFLDKLGDPAPAYNPGINVNPAPIPTPPPSPTPAPVQTPLQSTANFCPQCGKPVNPGAAFCTSCGSRVTRS